MIKLGVTGGIGSGKSVVCHLLEVMGIPVYYTDPAARQLMVTDSGIREGLIALLGSEVYKEGQLNKPLVASFLFSDKAHAALVNAIVHPVVRNDFRRWAINHLNYPIIAIESAILFEAGFAPEVDRIAVVRTSDALRIQRTMKRDGLSEEQVVQRIQIQQEEYREYWGGEIPVVDFVLINNESEALIPQIDRMVRLLSGGSES